MLGSARLMGIAVVAAMRTGKEVAIYKGDGFVTKVQPDGTVVLQEFRSRIIGIADQLCKLRDAVLSHLQQDLVVFDELVPENIYFVPDMDDLPVVLYAPRFANLLRPWRKRPEQLEYG